MKRYIHKREDELEVRYRFMAYIPIYNTDRYTLLRMERISLKEMERFLPADYELKEFIRILTDEILKAFFLTDIEHLSSIEYDDNEVVNFYTKMDIYLERQEDLIMNAEDIIDVAKGKFLKDGDIVL